MKLGIVCVYYYADEYRWMLDLQVDQLQRMTPVADFTIYAAAARLPAAQRRQLAALPRVRLPALPHCDNTGRVEHAWYLDRLIAAAFADGCTHVCSLDADAWPICPDWVERLRRSLASCGAGFAAVHRSENGDIFLPHPSGYFMTREFYAAAGPALLPSPALADDPSYRAFLAATGQAPDTGIGYGWYLWRTGTPWVRLLRSNRQDLHWLIAGTYGGVFFHFGAAGRTPRFRRDKTRGLLGLAERLRHRPLTGPLTRLMERVYLARNHRVATRIAEELRCNPDALLQELAPIPDVTMVCMRAGAATVSGRGGTTVADPDDLSP